MWKIITVTTKGTTEVIHHKCSISMYTIVMVCVLVDSQILFGAHTDIAVGVEKILTNYKP